MFTVTHPRNGKVLAVSDCPFRALKRGYLRTRGQRVQLELWDDAGRRVR